MASVWENCSEQGKYHFLGTEEECRNWSNTPEAMQMEFQDRIEVDLIGYDQKTGQGWMFFCASDPFYNRKIDINYCPFCGKHFSVQNKEEK